MNKNPDTISKAHLAAARAVDALRRQLGIIIEENGHSVANQPMESLGEEWLETIRGHGPVLLITSARARSLGLGEQAIKIDVSHLPLAQIQELGDPLCECGSLQHLESWPASEVDILALTMAKHAALLPALLLFSPGALTEDWPCIAAKDARNYFQNPMLDIVPLVQTSLPMEHAENAKVSCFRERYGTSVHLALTIGEITSAPLVRIHSSCFTGDVLGSLRCDCGDQLQLALSAIKEAGSGILIYLHQEGRGIGLANKLRAYQLQERGIDTYAANRMLGFEEDERDFSIAGAILQKLGIATIRMLTNNPSKMDKIQKAGVKVSERVPLIATPGKHNQHYLDVKGKKAGHLF